MRTIPGDTSGRSSITSLDVSIPHTRSVSVDMDYLTGKMTVNVDPTRIATKVIHSDGRITRDERIQGRHVTSFGLVTEMIRNAAKRGSIKAVMKFDRIIGLF